MYWRARAQTMAENSLVALPTRSWLVFIEKKHAFSKPKSIPVISLQRQGPRRQDQKKTTATSSGLVERGYRRKQVRLTSRNGLCACVGPCTSSAFTAGRRPTAGASRHYQRTATLDLISHGQLKLGLTLRWPGGHMRLLLFDRRLTARTRSRINRQGSARIQTHIKKARHGGRVPATSISDFDGGERFSIPRGISTSRYSTWQGGRNGVTLESGIRSAVRDSRARRGWRRHGRQPWAGDSGEGWNEFRFSITQVAS